MRPGARAKARPEHGRELAEGERTGFSAAFAAELHVLGGSPVARAGDARRGDRFDARPSSSGITARAGPGGGPAARAHAGAGAWTSQRRRSARHAAGGRSPPAPPPARAVEERSSAVEADEGGKGGLISPATAAAVDSAFDTLARRVLVQTAARSRIWSAKCCGRCSRPGSTTIFRAWSSAWCAPRSSAFRAAEAEQRALRKSGNRFSR